MQDNDDVSGGGQQHGRVADPSKPLWESSNFPGGRTATEANSGKRNETAKRASQQQTRTDTSTRSQTAAKVKPLLVAAGVIAGVLIGEDERTSKPQARG